MKTAEDGLARTGEIVTPHGVIHTPAFMPVATKAVIKRISYAEMDSVGADILMANTYHLALRPGSEVIRDMGGLHGFTGRNAPWITDSGGFQVFSLETLGEINDSGVVFRSHLDGSKMFLGPRESMTIQSHLGADIIMAFDQCASHTLPNLAMKVVVERTSAWARICLDCPRQRQALYGIVQGGVDQGLREWSAQDITSLPFDGYAMGGLAVGEGHDTMLRVLKDIPLPSSKPRYLMGVGWPHDIMAAVALGYDQFDCVLPSRNGRNGMALTSKGKINLKRSEFQRNSSPIEEGCDCQACTRHSRSFLHHLLHTGEVLGGALVSLHNLRYYERLMSGAREAIRGKTFGSYARSVAEVYAS
ncbi:MAG: tRNA guanosine(34) transglycosylase Tgt [Planctomycetota bacterium]